MNRSGPEPVPEHPASEGEDLTHIRALRVSCKPARRGARRAHYRRQGRHCHLTGSCASHRRAGRSARTTTSTRKGHSPRPLALLRHWNPRGLRGRVRRAHGRSGRRRPNQVQGRRELEAAEPAERERRGRPPAGEKLAQDSGGRVRSFAREARRREPGDFDRGFGRPVGCGYAKSRRNLATPRRPTWPSPRPGCRPASCTPSSPASATSRIARRPTGRAAGCFAIGRVQPSGGLPRNRSRGATAREQRRGSRRRPLAKTVRYTMIRRRRPIPVPTSPTIAGSAIRYSSTRRRAHGPSGNRLSRRLAGQRLAERVEASSDRRRSSPCALARTSTCAAGSPCTSAGGRTGDSRTGRPRAPTTRSGTSGSARPARPRTRSRPARGGRPASRSGTMSASGHGRGIQTTYSSPTSIMSSRPSTLLKLAKSVGATRSRSEVISAIARSGDSDEPRIRVRYTR